MSYPMFRQTIFIILIVLCAGGISCSASGYDPGFEFNNSVNPGDDFYSYVNDAWNAEHPVPEDKTSYSSFDLVRDRIDDDLHLLFEKAANASPGTSGGHLSAIGQFYRSGMDTDTINREGLHPFDAELDTIASMQTRRDLTETLVYLLTKGFDSVYSYSAEHNPRNSSEMIAGFSQGSLGLPDRDYYLRSDNKSLQIQDAYITHITRVLELMGESEEQAAEDAKTVYQIEKTLAASQYTREQNRDPEQTTNISSLSELMERYPSIGWDSLSSIPLSGPVSLINVHQPTFARELQTLLETTPLDDWKVYLRYRLVNDASPYLSQPFEEENFDFYSRILGGMHEMKPRWKRVVQVETVLLADPVGRAYVSAYVDPRTRTMVSGMFHSIRETLSGRIANLTWMSGSTRAAAQDKLAAMREKIAYPDTWLDYSGLNLTDVYATNVMEASSFLLLHGPSGLDKIGRPEDPDLWFSSPQTVNAFYNPVKNEMVFPAGILQPPFFSPDADPAINYGTLGWVIGHEITHGFDDMGRQYDKNGNLNDWWTAEDAGNYTGVVRPLVTQYNGYEVLPGLNVNGNLTLRENIADLGGLTLSYHAFEKGRDTNASSHIPGFSQRQIFFLSAAQLWKGNDREEYLRTLVYTDPHTPKRYRINGLLFNIPEFYQAFQNISPGDALYRDSSERPVIW